MKKKHEKTCQIYGEKLEKNMKKDEKSEGIKPLFFFLLFQNFESTEKEPGNG